MAQNPENTTTQSPNYNTLISVCAPLVLIWTFLCLQLRYHWGAESYYNYGWAIPFFTIFLLYRRYITAPASITKKVARSNSAVILFIAVALLFIPFRLLNEVNPFWRVPLLAEGLLALIATFACLAAVGTRRLVFHFAFPCFFLLTMVPWPYQIEVKIIQAFTQATAQATVMFMQFLGHPAALMGNVITIGESRVGVDDACSGIRSLQALGMIALFLGEFFMFKLPKRIFLIIATIGTVLTFNTARSITLTLIVVNGGNDLYHEWHDNVGMITFVLSVVALYGFSELLAAISKDEMEAVDQKVSVNMKLAPLKGKLTGVLLLLIALPEIAVAGWFYYKESQSQQAIDWTMEWPKEDGENFKMLTISDSIKDILNFDYGERAWMKLNKNMIAEMYYYGYTGENPMTSVSSYGHSPTICMEASGARLVREADPLNIEFENFVLPLHHYQFVSHPQSGSIPIQVFWCIWERRNMGIDPLELTSTTRLKQLEMLALGRRDYGRKVVLVAVPGNHNMGTVRIFISKIMSKMVQEIENKE